MRDQEAAAKLLNTRVGQVKAELMKEYEKLIAKNNKADADVVKAIAEGINSSYVGINPENMYIESVVGGYESRHASRPRVLDVSPAGFFGPNQGAGLRIGFSAETDPSFEHC